MNVFLIPLQERISLSLLHPSSPSLSLIIFISIFSYLHLSLISQIFVLSLSKSIFRMLHFVFCCHVNYFSWIRLLDLLILLCWLLSRQVYLSIYPYLNRLVLNKACVLYLLLFLFSLVYLSHIFLCLSTSFLSFSNSLLSLWRFPIFIPLSRCTTTWLTKKRKRTRKVFLIESVYQCINMCIYTYV